MAVVVGIVAVDVDISVVDVLDDFADHDAVDNELPNVAESTHLSAGHQFHVESKQLEYFRYK